MDNPRKPSIDNSNKDLLRYAGLGTQLLAAIGLSVFAGLKADQWLRARPVFACILPLLVLGAMFYKLARETGKRKDGEQK